MELLLRRVASDPDSTLGIMYVDGSEFCFTLEDEHRDVKVMHETRIPAGRYEIKVRNEGGMNERYKSKFGSKHKGMLWLQDVPNFKWIYIHVGNTEDHTSGCILTGFGCSIKPYGKWRTVESTDAYLMLASLIYEAIDNDEQVFIRIQDEDV